MNAAEFNELFDAEIVAVLISHGAEQSDRSGFWQSASLSVAILRTESRYIPPPQLALLNLHHRGQLPRSNHRRRLAASWLLWQRRTEHRLGQH